jgi:hypothetical protein
MPRLNSPSEGTCLRRISSWVPPPHHPSHNEIGSRSPGQREKRPCGECNVHEGGCMSTLALDCSSSSAAHAGTNSGPSRCSPDRTATPLGVPNMRRAEMVCQSKTSPERPASYPKAVNYRWSKLGRWRVVTRGPGHPSRLRRTRATAPISREPSLGPRSTISATAPSLSGRVRGMAVGHRRNGTVLTSFSRLGMCRSNSS